MYNLVILILRHDYLVCTVFGLAKSLYFQMFFFPINSLLYAVTILPIVCFNFVIIVFYETEYIHIHYYI